MSEIYEPTHHSMLRKISASVALLGALASTNLLPASSADAAPARIESVAERDHSDTHLPPINDPTWVIEQGSGITVTTKAAEATYDKGKFTFSFADNLPKPYREAFVKSLENPIVELAASKGVVKSFSIQPTDLSDNGAFDPGDESVTLEVSNGKKKNRIYFDERLMEAVLVHESLHGLSESWYQFASGKPITNDAILQQKIDSIISSCRVIRDDAYRQFISGHRDQLATAYAELSKSFSARASSIASDDNPRNAADSLKLTHYSEDMSLTAQAIRDDSPAVYAMLDEPGCNFADLFEIPFYVPDNDPSLLGAFYEYPESQPIYTLESESDKIVDEKYAAVKDGLAEAAMLGVKKEIPGGHAFDNPTEATSSLFTILAVNPQYLEHSLDKLDGPRKAQLENLLAAIIDITKYTNPELVDILSRNSHAANMIQRLSVAH